MDYPPTRAIGEGAFGDRPLRNTRWVTAAGGRDCLGGGDLLEGGLDLREFARAGQRQRFVAPCIPVDGIVRVLLQIRAGFAGESVWHDGRGIADQRGGMSGEGVRNAIITAAPFLFNRVGGGDT